MQLYILKIYGLSLLSLFLNDANCANPSNRLIDTLWRQAYTTNPNPVINNFTINTRVNNRFAETLVTSVVHNKFFINKQTTFSVVLPDSAFITGFSMEINGKEYKSFVDDREVVKRKYTTVNAHGGAHVSTRDSNEFDITVNLESRSTTVFKLYYEELLERKKSRYEILSNIFPRQLVENLYVEISINEDEKIAFINEPYLRTGNEILTNKDGLDANAIVKISSNKALVKFTPSIVQQFKLSCYGLRSADSFAGQFVVEYDVERSSQSQVLADDGYFINFFAPTNLEPLVKHIVFILDTSWSMSLENRLVHLKDAMRLIMPMIASKDVFHIISFANKVTVWDIEENSSVQFRYIDDSYSLGLTPPLQSTDVAPAASATKENINKGIDIVDKFVHGENTNIIGALTVGLDVIRRTKSKFPDKFQPLMVFLTDGEPVGAMSDTERITSIYTQENTLEVPTYTISLGEGANRTFLDKLARKNGGFEKHIYEGVDKAMQLHNFYDDISVPVLSKVQFQGLNGIADLTGSNVPLVFNGSEVRVAGRGGIWKISKNKSPNFTITGKSNNGTISYKPSVKVPSAKLERLWAYLTVKQLLADRNIVPNKQEITKKALNISLTYSLLTDVTALVVVKPNEKSSIDIKTAFSGPRPTVGQNPICTRISWPSTTTTPKTTSTITTTTPTSTITTTTTTTAATTTSPITTTTTNISLAYNITTATTPFSTTAWSTTTPTTTSSTTTTSSATTQPTTTTPKEDIFHTPDQCQLNIDPGPCKNYTLLWAYDNSFGGCVQFHYGGCQGNENRFNTKYACEKVCVKMDEYDKCTLAYSKGPCSGNFIKWYHNDNTKECTQFTYGGCLGNSNKFENKQDCEKECVKPKEEDMCDMTPDTSRRCNKREKRYYFNGNRCVSFRYFGCDDNKKGFESLDECKLRCLKTTASCGLSKDIGHCSSYVTEWYFDSGYGKCLRFIYSGCGGNGNRFKSENECNDECVNVDSIEKCNLPKVTGPCLDFKPMWYFDSAMFECMPFDYGGCHGNTNRFVTKEECERNCEISSF